MHSKECAEAPDQEASLPLQECDESSCISGEIYTCPNPEQEMGPCSVLHYAIWGHVVYCIMPYGIFRRDLYMA